MTDPRASSSSRPSVILWFRLYCVLACLLLSACLPRLCGFWPSEPGRFDPGPALLLGVVLAAFAVPLRRWRPRPWLWWYALGLIWINPVFVFFWFRPEVKRYFNMEVPSASASP